MARRNSKPLLLVTLGYTGSGKTFFSRRFAKEHGFFHLNSDRLRLEMTDDPHFTVSEHAQIFRVMDYVTEELLSRGIPILYDANATKRIYRKRLRQIARKNKARYLLLYFKTPVDAALRRMKKRRAMTSKTLTKYHRPVPDEVLFKLKAEQEEPDRHEPHVVIDGTLPYKKQADLVVRRLQKS